MTSLVNKQPKMVLLVWFTGLMQILGTCQVVRLGDQLANGKNSNKTILTLRCSSVISDRKIFCFEYLKITAFSENYETW